MARGDVLDGVGFVKDDKVILEHDAAVDLFLDATEEREEEGVVHNENVGSEDAGTGALEKAGAVDFGEIGAFATEFGRAETTFRADLGPDFEIGFDVEIGERAVLRFFGPFEDAVEFGDLGSGEEMVGLGERFVEAAGAEIIPAALEHGVGELDWENLLEDGQILLDELFLEVDGVGGNNRFFALGDGEQDAGDEVAEALANASAGFDEEMGSILQGAGDSDGHLLLLGPEFKVRAAGKNAFLGEEMLDLGEEAGDGVVLDGADH